MQDALASLVAIEMKRQLRRELVPIVPPKMVEVHDAEELDELRRLQVGAWCNGGLGFGGQVHVGALSREERERERALCDLHVIKVWRGSALHGG